MSVQEFYSAQFANTKATNNKTIILNKILKEIFQKYINPAVEKGKFSCNVPDCISNDAIEELKELGYNIKTINVGYNQDEYIIEW